MLRPTTEKKWIWDLELNQLVQKIEVKVQVVGTGGTVFEEEGPLFVSTGQEIFEAVGVLRERLQSRLASFVRVQSNP